MWLDVGPRRPPLSWTHLLEIERSDHQDLAACRSGGLARPSPHGRDERAHLEDEATASEAVGDMVTDGRDTPAAVVSSISGISAWRGDVPLYYPTIGAAVRARQTTLTFRCPALRHDRRRGRACLRPASARFHIEPDLSARGA
jgi:hypothetical protein